MKEHVRIGMAVKALFKGNRDSAQNQGTALDQAVRVVSLTHADIGNRHVFLSKNEAGDDFIPGLRDLDVG